MFRGRSFNSFCYRFIKFSFSKVSRPESPTRPAWRIQAGAWFTPTFSIIISKHFFGFIKFLFSKVSRPESRLDPVGGSKPEPGLLRRFQLSSQNILFVLLHFRLFNYAKALHFGNPINIYKFKRPITFTFNKMHLQNNAFIQCLCNVKDT